jgi:hypothetical protein
MSWPAASSGQLADDDALKITSLVARSDGTRSTDLYKNHDLRPASCSTPHARFNLLHETLWATNAVSTASGGPM